MSTCSTPSSRLSKSARTALLSTHRQWKAGLLRGRKASVGIANSVPALCGHIEELLAERANLRAAVVKAVNGRAGADSALRSAFNAIPAGVRRKLG